MTVKAPIAAAARACGMTYEAFRAWESAFLRQAKAALKPVATSRSTTSPSGTVALRENRTPKLEDGFSRLGLSESAAKVAAGGRSPRSSKVGSLLDEGQRLGFVPAAAKAFARGRGFNEAATKHEDPSGSFAGGDFPADSYAYTPDLAQPDGWALQLTSTPGGAPEPDFVKAAVAAIDPSNPADCPVPEDALPDVRAKLASAWTKAGLGELPAILSTESARRAFGRLGISSEAGLSAAVRGRVRRS